MYYTGGGNDMAFSIRLTEEERALAESYAKLHSYSLAEAFKRALFERIGDEYDIIAGNETMEEYIDSGCKSTPILRSLGEALMITIININAYNVYNSNHYIGER